MLFRLLNPCFLPFTINSVTGCNVHCRVNSGQYIHYQGFESLLCRDSLGPVSGKLE